jgi:2-polyprenyl-3-methyl-5-hydroxy-6-metoxy-1,4-benzoquinol methylase
MALIVSSFVDFQPYLSGEKFHSDFQGRYRRGERIPYRNDVLTELCRGKTVLHIGCCDHAPLVRAKIESGEWLHGQLSLVAGKVVGIDIDADAVATVSRLSGLTNIVAADVSGTSEIPQLSNVFFDIVLFGEVVEHIGNPVMFLQKFVQRYGRNLDRIVITVPNALRAGNIKGVFLNREIINSDHRLFFTPYTISKIAYDAGIMPATIQMASFTRQSKLKNMITSRWPLLAENIILTGTVRPDKPPTSDMAS